jgi:hypothetical protein
MAQFWIHDEASNWMAVPLGGDTVVLTGDSVRPSPLRAGSEDGSCAGSSRAVVVRSGEVGSEVWVLAAAADAAVHVNGQPLHLGLRVLRDKDEVRVGNGASLFFSAERSACIGALVGAGSTVCPRCKQGIDEQSPIVRCPRCGVVHHQSEELPCWTGYEGERFPTCAVCDQPSMLGADLQWTPEDL